MNFTNQIDKLVKSSEENPLKSEFIKTWLSENWQLYLDTVDNNSCTNRQSNFPCFCCIRKDDCLFVDIYNKLSIIETFDSVTEAQKKTGAVTIAKAIKTNGRRVGFYWEYANKDIVQSS